MRVRSRSLIKGGGSVAKTTSILTRLGLPIL
jgi:hypothetical protein